MQYTLGMAGPVLLSELKEFLYPSFARGSLPVGLGGSPVNLLCRELLSRGHRLVILTLDKELESEVVLEGPRVKVCIGKYRPGARDRALDLFSRERAYLTKTIRRERPDVVHAQWTYEFALGAIEAGLPTIVTAHDAPITVLRTIRDSYRFLRTVMAYRALRSTRRLVAVSPYVAEHLRRFWMYRGAVDVIPNGLPSELFRCKHGRTGSIDSPVFATVLNGWGGLKNSQRALESFGIVRRHLPRARLIMFGVGHERSGVGAQWAQERKLEAGVEFAGMLPYRALIDRLENEVDVLVHPSLEEAHCMAVIESMALGLPVIGGKDSGGVPWTLDFGKAGLLVDVRDAQELATGMLNMAARGDVRASLAHNGHVWVTEHCRIESVANAYEAIYESILEGASCVASGSVASASRSRPPLVEID